MLTSEGKGQDIFVFLFLVLVWTKACAKITRLSVSSFELSHKAGNSTMQGYDTLPTF